MPNSEDLEGLFELQLACFKAKLEAGTMTAADHAVLYKIIETNKIQVTPKNKSVQSIVKQLEERGDEDDGPIPFPISK
jgi:hypothetical protein